MKFFSYEGSKTRSLNFLLRAFVSSWLFLPAMAQAAPFTYGPPTCDFNVTFPEKPFIEKKCSTSDPDDCEEVATYTHTIESSAVNFRLTCKKTDSVAIKLIQPDDLKKRLTDLVKEANLNLYASDSATLPDDIKTSIAMATGRRYNRDVIYTGQMWLGKNSVLTLEGEMTGPENKEINVIYGDVLKNIKSKTALTKTP